MAFDLITAEPGGALDALAATIDRVRNGASIAPVTVIVPTNVAGVMARRALGRERGVIGVDMLTLNRLAELLAGPTLAAARRRPVSPPVLELTVRKVLEESPGSFSSVADHPSTVRALRELHEELRLAGPEAHERLEETSRGREAVRVGRAVTGRLEAQWYDEADLFDVATERLATLGSTLADLIVYLPARLDGLPAAFLRRVAELVTVHVVIEATGDDDADASHLRTIARLGLTPPSATGAGAPLPPPAPARVLSTTDADDEVNIAVRCIVDAARGALTGERVPFERIAVLWPAQQPYARLVEHHLRAAGIPWNGSGGTELTERLAPRLLLDLLDIDRRGLRRRALFELLADVPAREPDGRPRPSASWERVSRVAGISQDPDWVPRLESIRRNERWADSAESLLAFVRDLRSVLGHPRSTRHWREWAEWSTDQLEGWLGHHASARLSDPEYRAWESLLSALERLACLDEVSDPVTRAGFRAVLESELQAGSVREGRIGTGVTVGSLASAGGLDVDVAIVLGGAEGLLPPPPRSDALISEADRERAGLTPNHDRADRLHHGLRVLVASVHTVVTVPRGDLRTTSTKQITRWLAHLAPDAIEVIPSSSAGLAAVDFAPSERERRIGDLLRANRLSRPLDDLADEPLRRRLAMRAARESDEVTVYDGDLSGASVPSLFAGPVSPTQIEAWAACPHAYFVNYLLGVRPIDEPDSEISITAMDRGSLQHDALDRFHRDVVDGTLPQPTDEGWTGVHAEALVGHFDEVCERFERRGKTGRPATWAGQRARMRRELLSWLDHDGALACSRRVEVLDSEHRFPDELTARAVHLRLPDDRLLPVKGSVDRLDRTADGTLIVTDHKTGRADKFRGLGADDPTLAGTVFQLPTYAAAALARFGDADTTVRSEYSMFERGRFQRIGYEFTPEVWSRVAASLDEVVSGIESGWFPQVPERPGFRLWPSCRFCEPDSLGTAEAWGRWQRKQHDDRITRWFGPDADESAEADDV